LLAKLDLAAADARIQQVVHQSHHMRDLSRQHLYGMARTMVHVSARRHGGRIGPVSALWIDLVKLLGTTQDFDREEDRCKRVPEFMGEHGQELRLVAVGLAQRLFVPLAFGDVVKAVDRPDHVSPLVFLRPNIYDHRDPGAFRALDDHLRVADFRQRARHDLRHRALRMGHEGPIRTKQFVRAAEPFVGISQYR
jgi:hypothetical protein